MDEDELLCYAALAIVIQKQQKKKLKKRRVWMKEWLQKRNSFSHTNLLNELKLNPKDWHNYLRMDEETYFKLLSMVTPLIKKQDTILRQSITPHERLTATLRFLATGRSYEDLKFSTIISPQALGKIIPETCDAIFKGLKDYYKFPSCKEDWRVVGKGFEYRWNFPNCLGAIDGKHIAITAPPGAGSFFYNYKGFHSQVLLAIANSNYELIYFNFGTNGRVSDGGVFENSDLARKLKNGTLNLPEPSKVDNIIFPYVFVGDEAFRMTKTLLKPFSQKQLTKERRIFNYRLSRTRRIIENVFGILVARFGVLQKPLNVDLVRTKSIVFACCALHNFLRKLSPQLYTPPDCLDREDQETGNMVQGLRSDSVLNLQRSRQGNQEHAAIVTREHFMQYFNTNGRVPWQDNFV